MDTKISTQNNSYVCSECRNENKLDKENTIGDIFECKFCGIEYEIVEKDEEGNALLSMIDEEK